MPRPRRPPRRGGPPRPDGRHTGLRCLPPPSTIVEGAEEGRVRQLGGHEDALGRDLARRAEQQAEIREAPGHRGRSFNRKPQLEVQLHRGEDVERLGQQLDQRGGPIRPDGAVVRRRARAPSHHRRACRGRHHQPERWGQPRHCHDLFQVSGPPVGAEARPAQALPADHQDARVEEVELDGGQRVRLGAQPPGGEQVQQEGQAPRRHLRGQQVPEAPGHHGGRAPAASSLGGPGPRHGSPPPGGRPLPPPSPGRFRLASPRGERARRCPLFAATAETRRC